MVGVSATGSLVYVPGPIGGTGQTDYTIALIDRAGRASQDDKWVAYPVGI